MVHVVLGICLVREVYKLFHWYGMCRRVNSLRGGTAVVVRCVVVVEILFLRADTTGLVRSSRVIM